MNETDCIIDTTIYICIMVCDKLWNSILLKVVYIKWIIYLWTCVGLFLKSSFCCNIHWLNSVLWQVQMLLKESEEARGGIVSSDTSEALMSSDEVSSSSQVISQHLVTFRWGPGDTLSNISWQRSIGNGEKPWIQSRSGVSK